MGNQQSQEGQIKTAYTWYSTAEDVSKDINLTGKNIIVTGANTGIGKETARVLAKRGANVFIACRDMTKGNAARDLIINETGNSNVELMELDLSSFASIKSFVNSFRAKNIPLNILINNAGVMAVYPQRRTTEGWEMQFGTNHVGHFLLTMSLIPELERSFASD